MPNTDSFPKVTSDWEGVLAAAEENAALLPDVQAEQTELKQKLEKVKSLKDRQSSFRAAKQETTQELKKTLAEGRQIAEKLRDAAKFKIGRRNERLVQFQVAPLRKRAGKGKAKAKAKKKALVDAAGGGTPTPATAPEHPKPTPA
jgi:septal ring factor EnvC (AmiA/AmiB activator)